MSKYDAIYAVVRQIPWGHVATYGQVAELAKLPGHARLVGYALYRVDMSHSDVPWQRVVNAKGEISHSVFRHGSDYEQRSLLEAEGVQFNANGKIDLACYRWNPDLNGDATSNPYDY
ncbi:MAG: methyltransferase [Merismopedia sp. SIO2A8]|nr:methyltransferase [Symploca sp. SIO2B6]NET47252.1 methyltransferase [Merismopedia sp. SIO2A8]